jgi:hypothetical protein
MGEKEVEKATPPGREEQVKALKGKVDNPYAVAWASYKKGKEARTAKKMEKDSPWGAEPKGPKMSHDPTWSPSSKPGKLEDPKFGDAPGVASLNPGKAKSQNLTGKAPKNQVDELPVHKNDTLIDPKNQNDPEKRLKTLEGGLPSVLPGDKKVAEPFKSEGSGGEPVKAKALGKGEFDGSDKTVVGKKPAPVSAEPKLTPLSPQGQEPGQQIQRIRTFLGSKKTPMKKGEVVGRPKPAPLGKDETAVKETIVREDEDGKEKIVREEKPVKKAAGMPAAPSMPKPKGALSLSNPGGTPGGAMKTDNPMVKEVFTPGMKMRKNMEKFEELKKRKGKKAEPVKKQEMTGLAGMGMGMGQPSLGAGGAVTQNAAGTPSGAGVGGGTSPRSSMDMIGSKPSAPAVAPKSGGPLGGVGRV